jgi:hypothetical protein
MPILYLLPNGLRYWCRVLQWSALAIAIAVIVLSAWLGAAGKYVAAQLASLSGPAQAAVVFTPLKTWITQGLGWMAALASLLIPLGAALVFRAFASGRVFEAPAVRAVSTFGWMIVAFALIQTLSPSLAHLALTYDNPPGLRVLTFSLSSTHVITLLVGLVILVIGQVYTRAADIADDHRQIV